MASSKSFLKIIFFFLLVAVVIGCSKQTDPGTNTHNPKMLIVNASPNAPQLGLYVNSGTIFSNLAFTNTYGYFQLGEGDYAMQIFRTDTATTYLQDTIISANNDTTYKNTDSILYRITSMVTLDTAKITVKADSAYSMFMIDSAKKLNTVFIPDHLADSASGTPKIRFFNFSPNAPAVDLTTTSGQILFSNRGYKDVGTNQSYASFSSTSAGTVGFSIRLAGTTTVIASVTGVTFLSGKLYTLYAKGFYGGTGAQTLSIGVVANN